MINKVIHIPGEVCLPNGVVEPSVRRVYPGRELTKTAAAVSPKIIEFARSGIRPEPDKVYAMMGAIGASEIWGPNLNSDWWPEDQLDHDGLDYGYMTFLNAHIFCHHKNQDPKFAVGRVLFAAYNDTMHRAETVIEVSRRLAEERNGMWLYRAIEADEPVDSSMGAKVAYDICSKCGFKTLTPRTRCECISNPQIRGSILPDGRVVCMINIRPRFFDQSGVGLRADNNGFSYGRVSPGAKVISIGVRAASPCMASTSMGKVASATFVREGPLPGEAKVAEIAKRVDAYPPEFFELFSSCVPPMAQDDLDSMSLSDAQNASLALAAPLTAPEFMRLALRDMGRPELADHMDAAGCCFEQGAESGGPAEDFGMPSQGALAVMSKHVPTRGLVGAPLDLIRQALMSQPTGTIVAKITIVRGNRKPLRTAELDKVSAAYDSYQNAFVSRISDLARAALIRPEIRKWAKYSPNYDQKVAGLLTDIVGAGLLTTMLGRHAKAQSAIGAPVGAMASMARKMPLSFMGTAALLMHKLTPQAVTAEPVRGINETSLLHKAVFGS